MHVMMLCAHAKPEEVAAIELGFKRAGDRFTDITGKSPFIINFRGLDQFEREGHPIFLKVEESWSYNRHQILPPYYNLLPLQPLSRAKS